MTLKPDGYSKEEEYFYRVNRDLIDRRRAEADLNRMAAGTACPKCSQPMMPVTLLGINVDQCQQCRGIYLDQAELDTLIQTQAHPHFFSAFWKLIHGTIPKADLQWKP